MMSEKRQCNLVKILVIDDSINDFKLAEKVYRTKDKNIEVLYAKNGIQGLHQLNKNELPDVILLDIYMPQLNGIEFLKRIRKYDIFNDIRVIITSAMNIRDYPELKDFGDVEFQQKPISIEKYLEFIN